MAPRQQLEDPVDAGNVLREAKINEQLEDPGVLASLQTLLDEGFIA